MSADHGKFSDGGACSLEEMERRARMVHDLQIDEGERGMVLMALAHLAVERPGWEWALNNLACKMDNIGPDGKATMFEEFRRLHQQQAKEPVIEPAPPIALDRRLAAINLFAWLGEDELGSGVVGLKQALTPAGMIPLVATTREKMDQDYIRKCLQSQARAFGKTISLVKFVFDKTCLELPAVPSAEKSKP